MDQHLLVFVTVAEMGHFSRAAEELHMTQPAVSQYIQMLERSIGSKLLDRNSKFVRLNKAGEIVYHHAKQILGLYTRMQSLVGDLTNTASGELSIGASYTFGEYVLPYAVAALRQQYPAIKPVITIGNTTEISELVRNRQLDIGIVEGNFNKEKIVSECFAEDSMFITAAVGHRFSAMEEVSVSELREETWIVREVGSGTREAAERMFRTLQFVPDKLLQFGSTQIIKESVEAGLGITLLSQWTIRKELSLGSLRTVKVSGTPVIREFALIRQSTPYQTKAMELFWNLIRTQSIK